MKRPPTLLEMNYPEQRRVLVRFVERLIHNRDAAEDIVQEVYLKTLRYEEARDPNGCDPTATVHTARGYRFRSAFTTVIDEFRLQKRLRLLHLNFDLALEAEFGDGCSWKPPVGSDT